MLVTLVCKCGHALSDHCPFDGTQDLTEQWCGYGRFCHCNNFNQDNLRYLEMIYDAKQE